MSKRKSGETQQYIAYCNLVKAFKEAKRLIKSRRYSLICEALYFGGWRGYGIASISTLIDAKSIIRSRLEGYSNLSGWIRANTDGYDALYAESPNVAKECLRRTRLAWLDSLVAEFEAKAKKELKRVKRQKRCR